VAEGPHGLDGILMPGSNGLCSRADTATPDYGMRGGAILSEFGIRAKTSRTERPWEGTIDWTSKSPSCLRKVREDKGWGTRIA